jgi:NADPH2:quinone reductase
MNPADYKHIAPGQDRALLPLTLGYEAAGVVTAIGPDTVLASGPAALGDEVIAFQILGGYASALKINAADVFAKPAALDWPEAANLLLVGTTAAEMLDAANVRGGDVVLLHGASGAVGTSVLQQARLMDVAVIGTASETNFDLVSRYGGTPIAYGDGLEERARKSAPHGVDAALDTTGTDEAIDVSLSLARDRDRIVTIAAFDRAKKDGLISIGASNPHSGPFRAAQRARLIELARQELLEVPIGATYPFDDAKEAFAALIERRHRGKLAIIS